MFKEDTINIFVGTNTQPTGKVETDEDGFAVAEPDTTDTFANEKEPVDDTQPMPNTDIPEEERIVDEGDPVLQTVIEMCKKCGINKTIESLQHIAEKKDTPKHAKIKAKAIADELVKIKKTKSKKTV